MQALKEKQTLEQQLRLDRRERQNTQLAAKSSHEKAQAELDQSRAEIEQRNADVETLVCCFKTLHHTRFTLAFTLKLQ